MSTDLQTGFETTATPTSSDSDELTHYSNYCSDCAYRPGERALCGTNLDDHEDAVAVDCIVCLDLVRRMTHCAYCGEEVE